MVRKFFFLALLLLPGVVFMSSCKKEELSAKKEILSVIFEASKNPQLDRNYMGEINGTEILTEIAFGTDVTTLVPTIEISPRATLSPAAGNSTNFAGPVIYTVTAEDGTTKNFTISVNPAPAPYIGAWTGGPIDFGLGLMRVNLEIDAEGTLSMELVDILTSEKSIKSVKGSFPPLSRQDTEIKLDQTHHWGNNGWLEESTNRTIMYHVNHAQSIKFYYCESYPMNEWCLQLNLTKQ
ncbi:MAG: hypothetical protein A2X22_07740 [Bacteroidetes bacterium GWF2_49_14]|nr:MAG: hypothetical protein A2X22_07740 [Bacteroidetes bacterium GWF2_49_14]HBB90797.1 hypothetical protein [Bacteroidales bacterium]